MEWPRDPGYGAHMRSERWAWWLGGLAAGVFVVWSFVLALGLPLDTWDGYDYLVNARWLAGHDLTRLSQSYRPDRPPGISLLVAPVLQWYQPGQHGGAGLVHLVPWFVGVVGLGLLWRHVRTSFGVGVAFAAVALLALNPLFLHALPFVMADVPSMTFALWALVAAEQVVTTRRGLDVAALAVAVAGAMLCKYPVAALGLLLPLANVLWTAIGHGRPSGLRAIVRSLLEWRLLVPLACALVLFLWVQAAIFAGFVAGPGGGLEKLWSGMTSAWGSAGGGSTGGDMDPRWELVLALPALFGVPAVLLAIAGVGRALSTRDRRGLLHVTWLVGFLLLFSLGIAHKEARYAMPVLPSFVWLAASGATWARRRGVSLGLLAVALIGMMPVAIGELRRMHDPLYRRPSILAWARFALDRAGADRPILQEPLLPQFALYPRDPVVLPTDEFWHFHHFNEGGLTWFFDRRIEAVQVIPAGGPGVVHDSPWYRVQVPPDWLAGLGTDAVLIAGFPRGAVVVSTSQAWFETRTAAQAPEPPEPFVATDVQIERLDVADEQPAQATFRGPSVELIVRRDESGRWQPEKAPGRLFVTETGTPREWRGGEGLPRSLQLLRRERVEFPVR